MSDHRAILKSTDQSNYLRRTTVVTPVSMDPASWLRQQLEHADVDLLREMVRTFA